jgi:hypothetical protein
MICRKCGKEIQKKDLSRHSPLGNHLPEYIKLHLKCHKKLHSNPNWYSTKLNQRWIKEIEERK